MDPLSVVAVAGEVIAWVALVSAGLLLLAYGFANMADGAWDPTEVALVDRPGGEVVRWFAGGEFHERALEEDEHPLHGDEGELVGYVRRRTPDRLRFEAAPHLPRVLGTVGAILAVIGVAASVASTVADVVAA